MTFLAVGYMVIWLLLLGYTGLLHSQQSKLRRDLKLVEELLEAQAPSKSTP